MTCDYFKNIYTQSTSTKKILDKKHCHTHLIIEVTMKMNVKGKNKNHTKNEIYFL